MTLAHARALLLQSFAATMIFINVPATDLYTSHWKHVTFQNVFLAIFESDVSGTPNPLLVSDSWTICIAFVPYLR